MATINITFQLDHHELDETYTLDIDAVISRPERDVGWMGDLAGYSINSVTPTWPYGIDRLYDILSAHEAEIEAEAFANTED